MTLQAKACREMLVHYIMCTIKAGAQGESMEISADNVREVGRDHNLQDIECQLARPWGNRVMQTTAAQQGAYKGKWWHRGEKYQP